MGSTSRALVTSECSSDSLCEQRCSNIYTYRIWANTLILTVAAAAVSAFMLFIQLLGRATNASAAGSEVVSESGHDGPRSSHVARSGSIVLFALRIVQMLSCLALVALSIADLVLDQSNSCWLSFGVVGTYVRVAQVIGRHVLTHTRRQAYASLLAFVTVASRRIRSALFARHLAAVLLFTWAVYAYRDLWPLATFNLQPADPQGPLLWAKVAVLTLAAIVVPMIAPREYIPVDPKVSLPRDPSHAELTTSSFGVEPCTRTEPGADCVDFVLLQLIVLGSTHLEGV